MKAEKEHTCSSGRREGLRAFISSEYRSLVTYVRRYLNEKYYDISAEDIVQDVAVNLFSKLDIDETGQANLKKKTNAETGGILISIGGMRLRNPIMIISNAEKNKSRKKRQLALSC